MTSAPGSDRWRGAPRRRVPPVLLGWAFAAALTTAPYAAAALRPPPGRTFVGVFYYVDDAYNYLAFVQQAENGAFLFRNKLVPEEHPRVLVNLEWWLVGRLSAALGRRPLLAYRLFGLAASLALLAAVERWLLRAGLPDTHRLPALVLVSTGGGLGGLLFACAGREIPRCLDLYAGLFPFLEMLANPHFVAGTALLLWTLWAFLGPFNPAGILRATVLGSILGLVRPYDVALLAAIRTAGVLLTEAPSSWVRRLLPLSALAPVALYDAWVFFRNPAFSLFSNERYLFPARLDFLWALGPAALLALTSIRRQIGEEARRVHLHLWAWSLIGGAVIALRPVSFSLQFMVGYGLPLLALGALGLARYRPEVTLGAAAALGSTAAVAVSIVLSPNPRWYVPSARIEAVLALRASCRDGDIVFSPPDIGLYAAGLTACDAYVGHRAIPDYASREAEVEAFYRSMDAAQRSALLDRACVTQLLLPGQPGLVPEDWLGASTPFRRVAEVGRAPWVIGLYARPRRDGCRLGPASP